MAIFSIFPLVFVQTEPSTKIYGVNNAFRAVVWADAPCMAAVMAQEVREHLLQLMTLLLGIFAIAALWVSGLVAPEISFLMTPFALLPTLIWKIPAMDRLLELNGHAVDAAAAEKYYGQDLDAYEANEAKTMVWFAGYSFQGMTAEQVKAALVKRRPAAQRWIKRHAGLLEKAAKRWPAAK